MILEEGMVILASVSKVVNNDNFRTQGLYFVEKITDETTLVPLLKNEGVYHIVGRPLVMGQNTVTLGEWEFVEFVKVQLVPDTERTALPDPQSGFKELLGKLSRDDIIKLLQGKISGPTN